MLTANLDLTEEAEIKSKHVALTKEMRGNRKRLGQITKLRSKKDLTSEEREKIARKPLLESDLGVLEAALAKVVRLMEQRNMTIGHKQSTTNDTTESKEEAKEECKEADDPAEFHCELCDVVCPDRNHLDLHMNGRKHRNRVQQLEEEENRSVTESIHENSQRRASLSEERSSITSVSPPEKSDAQPRYRLPPPPLTVGPHSWGTKPETPTPRKNSNSDLRAIMAQEEKSQTQKRRPTTKKNTHSSPSTDLRTIMGQEQKKQSTRSPKPLNLGLTPSSQSPPWLVSPASTVKAQSPSPMVEPKKGVSTIAQQEKRHAQQRNFAPSAKLSTANPPSTDLRSIMAQEQKKQSSRKARSPKLLNPGPIPTLQSPPWLVNPVATIKVAAPSSVDERTKSVPLGAFLASPPKTKTTTTTAPWSSPSQPKPTVPDMTPPPKEQSRKSLAEIQQEEEDRASRASKTSVKDGKWFVRSTEHAGSFSAIQEKAEEERQMQILIEEQKQIEQQIEDEQRRKASEAKKRNRRKKKERSGSEGKASTKGRRQPRKQGNKKPGKQKAAKKTDNPQESTA